MYAHAYTNAMSLLECAHGIDLYDLRAMGFSVYEAARMRKLSGIYYGPTQYTRKREEAREAAVEKQHSLSVLNRIESLISSMSDKATKWDARAVLCATEAGDVSRVARELLAAHQDTPPARTRMTTRRDHRRGEISWTIIAPAARLADRETALREMCENQGPEALGAAFLEALDAEKVPTVESTPVVGVWLDEAAQVARGEGDDIVVTRSDGVTLTGAQLMETAFAEHGFAVLFDPSGLPLNLYRTKRHANFAQRIVSMFMQPTCSWPGCSTPAHWCQLHHMDAWKNGGLTNIDNLTPLCEFHNGLNDDDPDRPLNGRIEVIGGKPMWRSPRNGHAYDNDAWPNEHSPFKR